MRENKEHLAVVRALKRVLVMELKKTGSVAGTGVSTPATHAAFSSRDGLNQNPDNEEVDQDGCPRTSSNSPDADIESSRKCKRDAFMERKRARRESNPKPLRSWTDPGMMEKLRASALLFNDGTPPDIAEFTRPATSADLRAARTEEIMKAAQMTVQNGEQGSSVWFKHMRKSGGSTVRAVLEKAFMAAKHINDPSIEVEAALDHGSRSAVAEARRDPQTRSWDKKWQKAEDQNGGDAVERGFTLHHQEFDLFPVKCLVTTPRTVYITAIRRPTARVISLFYYDGPGAKNPMNSTEEMWTEWMDGGVSLMKFERVGGRLRKAFTGACVKLHAF